MTYATYQHHGQRSVGELHDDTLIPLQGLTELGPHTSTDVLDHAPRLRKDAVPTDMVRFPPVVPNPTKIICVATNYRDALANPSGDLPAHPALFTVEELSVQLQFKEPITSSGAIMTLPAATADLTDWVADRRKFLSIQFDDSMQGYRRLP
jgi:2-keto-4-pentenoate hydratase/2-oxohepta-3-ene-1,7-dioic acid hydratase in catechol pathway